MGLPKPPAPILTDPQGLLSGATTITVGAIATGLVVTIGSSTYAVTVNPSLPAGDWLSLSNPLSIWTDVKLPAVQATNAGAAGSAAQGVLGVSEHWEGVRGIGLGEGAGVAGINSAPAATAQPGDRS